MWIASHILQICKNPVRRILVLGERISQLQTLETMIRSANPSISIGYYIGGMKEEVRETAGKEAQLLLASYAMASEAMNIKSLNTVLLASPRKKVEQSVGRILRQRPGERQVDPLIVDVVDSHGVYQGQWRKRRTFYKACGYKFLFTNYGDEEDSEDSDEANESSKSEHEPQGCCIIET
jgi:hypothetical protein